MGIGFTIKLMGKGDEVIEDIMFKFNRSLLIHCGHQTISFVSEIYENNTEKCPQFCAYIEELMKMIEKYSVHCFAGEDASLHYHFICKNCKSVTMLDYSQQECLEFGGYCPVCFDNQRGYLGHKSFKYEDMTIRDKQSFIMKSLFQIWPYHSGTVETYNLVKELLIDDSLMGITKCHKCDKNSKRKYLCWKCFSEYMEKVEVEHLKKQEEEHEEVEVISRQETLESNVEGDKTIDESISS